MSDQQGIIKTSNVGVSVVETEDGQDIAVTKDGVTVTMMEMARASASFIDRGFLNRFIVVIARNGMIDKLREYADIAELALTPTAFEDNDKKEKMKDVMDSYSLRWWIKMKKLDPDSLVRADVLSYWGTLTKLFSLRGLSGGTINKIGNMSSSLWKATGALKEKMDDEENKISNRYEYIPGMLINKPEQVDGLLAKITDPWSFLEVLVGETVEDMAKCPEFIAGFSRFDDQVNIEGALITLDLILKHDTPK